MSYDVYYMDLSFYHGAADAVCAITECDDLIIRLKDGIGGSDFSRLGPSVRERDIDPYVNRHIWKTSMKLGRLLL